MQRRRLLLKNIRDTPGKLFGTKDISAFIETLETPRKIILMIQAGKATDELIEQLTPFLEKNDILIDGGNAYWHDTIRREKTLKQKGIFFIGSGVSGGEKGARYGPSLMPAGDRKAWEVIRPIWESIAAKVDTQGNEIKGGCPGKPVQGGEPCTTYIGTDGSGHYIKMVHNGIEYGDMQIICEAYDLLKHLGGLSSEAIGMVFERYNQGRLNSFLIEISAQVLKEKDPVSKQPFVEVVLDTAGQKGTGKWTSISGLDLGVPIPTIAEAVFARCMSSIKEERIHAAKHFR